MTDARTMDQIEAAIDAHYPGTLNRRTAAEGSVRGRIADYIQSGQTGARAQQAYRDLVEILGSEMASRVVTTARNAYAAATDPLPRGPHQDAV